ncbi:MAG: hypothetical protein ACLTKB_09120 [Lawsonibacter sp.]
MKKRNVDRIRELEHELGRYQKKVADQAKEAVRLRGELDRAYAGGVEAQRAMDAILIQTAVAYGQTVKDEETGEELGWRLRLPVPNVEEIHARYEIHARRDGAEGAYIIGVAPRTGT